MSARAIASFCFIPFENAPGSNVFLLPESQHLEEPLDLLSPLRFCTSVQLPVKIQVVVGGQVIVETHTIRNQSDDLPDLQRIFVVANLVTWYLGCSTGL